MKALLRRTLIRTGALLLVLSACANPIEPVPPPPSPTPDLSLLGSLTNTLTGVVSNTLRSITGLLTCDPQPYSTQSQVIGPAGGTLVMGPHRLVVPAGALDRDTRITGEVMPGLVNSVRMSPEGLHFNRSATLTLNYENCHGILAPKKIVYTSELLQILEVLQSLDQPALQEVQSPIDHFSRYAIAW